MRRKAFIEQTQWPPLMRVGMRFMNLVFRIASFPFLRDRHPWTRMEKTNVSWLPVNERIERGPDTPLPPEVVADYIRRSPYRAIVDFCGCRKSWECKSYPEDIGCLLMGESARDIPASVSHLASEEEALNHLKKAVDAGLVPVIGKARVDNFIYGVRDRGKMLTVCFCCECCCITRNLRYLPTEHLDRIFVPLEGASIEVTDKCVGCGTCVEHCFIGAVSVRDGRAVIGERCRVCGRCATHCPNEAIRVKLGRPDYKKMVAERIERFVDLS